MRVVDEVDEDRSSYGKIIWRVLRRVDMNNQEWVTSAEKKGHGRDSRGRQRRQRICPQPQGIEGTKKRGTQDAEGAFKASTQNTNYR